MKFFIRTIGIKRLLQMGYSAVRPKLVEWAESDGEDDWDDTLIEVLDAFLPQLAEKLDKELKI